MDAEGLRELFEPIGPIQLRRLFGGLGIYRNGRIIGFGGDGTIWLKTDERTRAAFQAAGSTPFQYERRDREPVAMSYWRLPDEGFDDPEALVAWVSLADEAASRAAQAKPVRRRAGARQKSR